MTDCVMMSMPLLPRAPMSVYCKVGSQSIIPEAMAEQRGGAEEGMGSPRVETLRDKRAWK